MNQRPPRITYALLILALLCLQLTGCFRVISRTPDGKRNVYTCFMMPSLGMCSDWMSGRAIDSSALPPDSEIRKILKKLNVTQEQRTKLRAIYQQAKDATQTQANNIQAARKALFLEVKKDKPDPQKVQNLIAKGYDLAKQNAIKRSGFLLKILAVFTPAQRKQLAKEVKELSKRYKSQDTNRFIPAYLR